MQIRLTVVDPLGPPSEPRGRATACDVLVTAPAGTALAAVASGLASAVGGEGGASAPERGREPGGGAVALYAGAERLDAQRRTLGEPPLIDGAVLSVGAPAEPGPEVDESAPRLDVVAGPDAGGVHFLHGGRVHIGRSADADVPLDDPDVSRLHCAVTVTEDGLVSVADVGSTNGTELDGTRVGDRPVRLTPGSLLRVGESALRLTPPGCIGAAGTGVLGTAPDGEGHVRVVAGDGPGDGPGGGASGSGTGNGGGGSAGSPSSPSSPSSSSAVTAAVLHARVEGDGKRVRTAGMPGPGRSPADPSSVVPEQGGALRIESGSGSYGHDRAPDVDARGGGTRIGSPAGTAPGTAAPSGESTGEGAPGPGGTRKGTPVRGTDAPRGARKRGGLTAWARRLAGGRGEQPGGDRDPYDEREGLPQRPPVVRAQVPEKWPDPAALLLTALGPGPRLWERGPEHPEALTVRLGTADRAAPDGSGLLPAVPVTAGLREVGALGLAGPRARLLGLARAVVAQLAALHSPHALELVLISTDRSRSAEERTADWSWLGWLPHVRPGHGQDCRLLLAYDRDQAAARVDELLRRLEDHVADRGLDEGRMPYGAGGALGETSASGETGTPGRISTPVTTGARDEPGMVGTHGTVGLGEGATGKHVARRPSWARDDVPAGAGFAGPYTVVLVDGDPGGADVREAVVRLALEGPVAGIHVVCLAETEAASSVTETYEAACGVSPVFRECGAVALLSGDVATALRLMRVAPTRSAGRMTSDSARHARPEPRQHHARAAGPAAQVPTRATDHAASDAVGHGPSDRASHASSDPSAHALSDPASHGPSAAAGRVPFAPSAHAPSTPAGRTASPGGGRADGDRAGHDQAGSPDHAQRGPGSHGQPNSTGHDQSGPASQGRPNSASHGQPDSTSGTSAASTTPTDPTAPTGRSRDAVRPADAGGVSRTHVSLVGHLPADADGQVHPGAEGHGPADQGDLGAPGAITGRRRPGAPGTPHPDSTADGPHPDAIGRTRHTTGTHPAPSDRPTTGTHSTTGTLAPTPSGPMAPGPITPGTMATIDAVSAAWAERFARALAPLRANGAVGERHARVSAPLPQSARLLDELGLARATPASLMARWADAADDAKAFGGRAWAVLGAGPRGPVCADLAAEGSHLLIEGPSGSGRTELLRSIAASLAAAERPDRLGIALMDGRDGSGHGNRPGDGLGVCADLPHVGTHLAAHDPVRMREFAQSLSAELKRRAALLGRLDFVEWHTQREMSGRIVAQRSGRISPTAPARGTSTGTATGSSTGASPLSAPGAPSAPDPGPPLARLVVIVDDLDALLSPPLGSPGRPAAGSVIRALEAVAREGARLGVHLVAATAGGARTAETELARAATLRVTLEAPTPGPDEPAPGRGQLTITSSRPTRHPADRTIPFQAGRVTGRIPRTATLRPTVVPLDWTRMGDPPTRRPVRELGNGPTDLALLASALDRAARSVSATEAPSLL